MFIERVGGETVRPCAQCAFVALVLALCAEDETGNNQQRHNEQESCDSSGQHTMTSLEEIPVYLVLNITNDGGKAGFLLKNQPDKATPARRQYESSALNWAEEQGLLAG